MFNRMFVLLPHHLFIRLPHRLIMSRVWPWGWVQTIRIGLNTYTAVKLGHVTLVSRQADPPF
jgi:hypothetical protein